jgi:hypothetical protein
MYCNIGRLDQTLRVTPAMEAGISLHVWSLVKSSRCSDASDKKAA